MAEELGFDSQQGQEIFPFSTVSKISSWAHPASYTMGSSQGVKVTTHFHLVPRSKMVELYLHSPIHLHGVVLNQLSTGTTLALPLPFIVLTDESYLKSLINESITYNSV
jgi:hypothetical protein